MKKRSTPSILGLVAALVLLAGLASPATAAGKWHLRGFGAWVEPDVYLRRQDYWIDSFFNQQVKDSFSIPTQEDLLRETKNYLLYYKNLEIWAEIFGRENLLKMWVNNTKFCSTG